MQGKKREQKGNKQENRLGIKQGNSYLIMKIYNVIYSEIDREINREINRGMKREMNREINSGFKNKRKKK